jgi:GT2 family glycosyltransferase
MKVTIVAAYNTKVEMTISFLDTMNATTYGDELFDRHMILVNGGCETDIKHPFIDDFVKLPTNEGFCKVLNEGLKRVPEDSDYVFFVGNDSFPTELGWLTRLIELQQRTQAWMVCPANDRPGMKAYERLYKADYGDYWTADFFPSIAWLMPYDKFKQTGLLDEGYQRTGMYADNDYCRTIKKLGGSIVVSKHIMLQHLLSQEGAVLGTQGPDMSQGLCYYREKWGEEP